MLSQAEAEMRAAQYSLSAIANITFLGHEEDRPAFNAELRKIETWLRRRAVGGDKILLRQMERPLGRQVAQPKRGFKRKP